MIEIISAPDGTSFVNLIFTLFVIHKIYLAETERNCEFWIIIKKISSQVTSIFVSNITVNYHTVWFI